MDTTRLLEAIRDGQLIQLSKGQGRTWRLDDELVTYMELRRLADQRLIELFQGWPPRLLPDGEQLLAG